MPTPSPADTLTPTSHDGRLDVAAIAQRARAAHEEATRSGEIVPIRLGTDDPSHWDYRADGGDYEDDPMGTETMCGDTSVGAEPSIQYTWATASAAAPYVTTRIHGYVEAHYTDADGERRQLQPGVDHLEAQEDRDARHAAWKVQNDRMAERFKRGGSWGDAGHREWVEHQETEPQIDYSLATMAETITHHDPSDVGGSLIDYSFECDTLERRVVHSLPDAETALRAHLKGLRRDRIDPLARI